jgi:2-dehydro-3-deoxygalactonokinase
MVRSVSGNSVPHGGMSSWTDGFAAVDWGSTARRAYVLDGGGRTVRELEDEAGTLTIPRERFAAEVDVLRQQVGPVPLLLAGMVGSNRGWMEAPYVPCPATLTDVAARLLWAEPGRTAIVPGVSLVEQGRGDVMRGEEVQVFGALALRPEQSRTLICHPGTHTKWIEADRGAILRFRTVMTGELFALLKTHSILSDVLAGPTAPDAAFRRGVERGFAQGELSADLFSIRAGVLLGLTERDEAASYASGLLIGCDLRTGLAAAEPDDEILVLGRGSLTRLYGAAIEQCGHRTVTLDGAKAFIAGMRAIAETIS